MSEAPSLRDVQMRTARLLSFEDGLWDLLLGATFMLLAIYPITPEKLGPEWNLALFLRLLVLALGIFVLVRQRVSAPRLGFVRPRWTPVRKGVLAVTITLVALTVGLVIVTLVSPVPSPEPAPTVSLAKARSYMVEIVALLVEVGVFLSRIIEFQYLTTEGVFGIPLGVSSTFVFLFILFGAFIIKCGMGKFFTDLSMSIAGASPGGPAKVAVIASGVEGMISGSSVANVVTSGSITIPLMKSIGYPKHFAGAVEAVASTGGQFMPPVMGAGAFVMAEFLGVPYARIALLAFIPACLYYLACYMQIHYRANKMRMVGVFQALPPPSRTVCSIPARWFGSRGLPAPPCAADSSCQSGPPRPASPIADTPAFRAGRSMTPASGRWTDHGSLMWMPPSGPTGSVGL